MTAHHCNAPPFALLLILCFIASACSPSDSEPGDAKPDPAQLATTLGVTVYSGTIDPIEESREGAEITYTFSPDQGPICMRGEPYRMAIRDTGSDDLVIFLQGGGACWTAFCLAVTKAPSGVANVDLLDPELEENPVRDWNVAYLPYCDGSFFAGDVSIDDDLNGKGIRHHRGLANLTASLEVAKEHFPNPKRILLAGSSGGAYGLLLGTPLARHYFPDATLYVMADSGIGLARNDDDAFLDVILNEFDLGRFLPDDCSYCRERGHLTGLVRYLLLADSGLRWATFSSWNDAVLSKTFLSVDPEEFAESFAQETDPLAQEFPDRFRRFVVQGTQHTSLLGDATGIIGRDIYAVELPDGVLGELLSGDLLIGGMNDTVIDETTMSDWLTGLVDDDLTSWTEKVEPR